MSARALPSVRCLCGATKTYDPDPKWGSVTFQTGFRQMLDYHHDRHGDMTFHLCHACFERATDAICMLRMVLGDRIESAHLPGLVHEVEKRRKTVPEAETTVHLGVNPKDVWMAGDAPLCESVDLGESVRDRVPRCRRSRVEPAYLTSFSRPIHFGIEVVCPACSRVKDVLLTRRKVAVSA